MDAINVSALKSIALRVPELIVGSQKIRSMPTLSIPTPRKSYADYSCTCPRFPTIFDWSFGCGCERKDVGVGG